MPSASRIDPRERLTATGASPQAVAAGGGPLSIADNATVGGGAAVDAAALGIGKLTLTGSAPETVTKLAGNVVATGPSCALSVTAVGAGAQTIATGTGASTIADGAAGSVNLNAAGKTITLSGSAGETATNLAANLVATGLSGALGVTTKTTSLSIATGSGPNTINAGALAAGQTLTLTGTNAATVTALGGNLTATGDSGALSVTTTGAAQTVTTGANTTSIIDNSTGLLTVNAAALAAGSLLTLSGAGAVTVTRLKGDLAAAGETGALTVTATRASPQTVAAGSGPLSIADSAAGGGVVVDAAAFGTGTLTLTGSAAETVKNFLGICMSEASFRALLLRPTRSLGPIPAGTHWCTSTTATALRAPQAPA